MQGIVKEVKPTQLLLKDGSVLDFGLCIWSTGVGPTQFIESLPFTKTKVGRVAVTEQLQVLAEKDQVRTEALFLTVHTQLITRFEMLQLYIVLSLWRLLAVACEGMCFSPALPASCDRTTRYRAPQLLSLIHISEPTRPY